MFSERNSPLVLAVNTLFKAVTLIQILPIITDSKSKDKQGMCFYLVEKGQAEKQIAR